MLERGAQSAVSLALLAALPLLQGCWGTDSPVSVRILTTASDPDLHWVQVTDNEEPFPPDCSIPHRSCEYEFDPLQGEELQLTAMGDGFDRWECSDPTSLPPSPSTPRPTASRAWW